MARQLLHKLQVCYSDQRSFCCEVAWISSASHTGAPVVDTEPSSTAALIHFFSSSQRRSLQQYNSEKLKKSFCFLSCHIITAIQLQGPPGSAAPGDRRSFTGRDVTGVYVCFFFYSHKLPKTLPVTMLLLFGFQTVNTIRSTCPWSMPPAFPFTQTPGRLCCSSNTTSRGATEPISWN